MLREMVARMAEAVAADDLNRYYPINLRFTARSWITPATSG